MFNDMMLEMNAEECLDHTYDAFLADTGNTEWGDPTLFTWRPWLWQTCTEFGWYQTTNQVKYIILHSKESKNISTNHLPSLSTSSNNYCLQSFFLLLKVFNISRRPRSMAHLCHWSSLSNGVLMPLDQNMTMTCLRELWPTPTLSTEDSSPVSQMSSLFMEVLIPGTPWVFWRICLLRLPPSTSQVT